MVNSWQRHLGEQLPSRLGFDLRLILLPELECLSGGFVSPRTGYITTLCIDYLGFNLRNSFMCPVSAFSIAPISTCTADDPECFGGRI